MELGLLHGFAATPLTWRHVVEPLAAVHRVVPFDRPWGPLADQVAATIAAIDHHHLARPVLVGHSAGAEVALATALARPSRVRALVLLGPVVGRRAPLAARLAAGVPGSERVGPAVLRAGSRFLGHALRLAWHDRARVTPEVVETYRRPLLEPGVAEAMWAMTKFDPPREELLRGAAELTMPCLVLVGSSDRWATPVPVAGAETVVFDDCGHLPHEEQPQQTVASLLGFTAALERAADG